MIVYWHHIRNARGKVIDDTIKKYFISNNILWEVTMMSEEGVIEIIKLINSVRDEIREYRRQDKEEAEAIRQQNKAEAEAIRQRDKEEAEAIRQQVKAELEAIRQRDREEVIAMIKKCK